MRFFYEGKTVIAIRFFTSVTPDFGKDITGVKDLSTSLPRSSVEVTQLKMKTPSHNSFMFW